MKKILIIFFLFPFLLLVPLCAQTEDAEMTLQGFLHLYPTINHINTSFHPAIAVGGNIKPLPLLAANISLGHTYFLEACLGGGQADNFDGGLVQYSFGLGNYDMIKKMENFYYTFALSLRNYNSTYINSSALVFEMLLEQKVDNLYVGLGLDLISQDYTILEGSTFIASSDIMYHASLIAYIRTGLVDVRACGLPGSLNINFSMNLNME